MDSLKLTSELIILIKLVKEESKTLNKTFEVINSKFLSEAQLYAKDIRHLEEGSNGSKIFFNTGMLLSMYESKSKLILELIDTSSLPDPEKVIRAYLQEYVMISEYELEMLVDTLLQNYLILSYGENNLNIDEDETSSEVFIEFDTKVVYINQNTLEVYSLCKT